MDTTEKRIDKLKTEQKKINEKITKLKEQSEAAQNKIEQLENERIITAFRKTGFSVDTMIERISYIKKDDEKFKKEYAVIEAEEKKEINKNEN